jgi:hypothetical protein
METRGSAKKKEKLTNAVEEISPEEGDEIDDKPTDPEKEAEIVAKNEDSVFVKKKKTEVTSSETNTSSSTESSSEHKSEDPDYVPPKSSEEEEEEYDDTPAFDEKKFMDKIIKAIMPKLEERIHEIFKAIRDTERVEEAIARSEIDVSQMK